MRQLVRAVIVCSVLAPAGSLAQQDARPIQSVPQEILEGAAKTSFPEFFEMLALPNDAVVPADIQKNADWLEAAFRKRGFATRQLPNDGKPLVFAEHESARPGRRTILFYMHFDGQPVIASQWSQKSPWEAVLKQRSGAAPQAPLPSITTGRASVQARWEELDPTRLLNGPIDPEWRIFARAASDDKGPIMMFLTAFDIMKRMGITPAVNVKVLLDGEEEKGSPTIGTVAKAHRELLAADAIVINDGPMHASNQPTIIFGNRGNTVVRLTVHGARGNLHSGHYGNYVPNPAQRLASLLASMKDENGRVTVKGYYDSVKLSDAERAIMAAVPESEAEIRARLGFARPEAVGTNLQEALQYPSLNIRGMEAAAVGDKGANIIPSRATAELDLRTTPGATPAQLFGLIEAHIRERGWHLTKDEPTEEERQRHDKIATLTMARGSAAAFTELDSPIGAWAQASLARTFARAPDAPAGTVRIRMMGGSVPTDKLVEALALPFVIVPLVNPDNNQHSFDENIRLGHFLDGTRAFVGMLQSPF